MKQRGSLTVRPRSRSETVRVLHVDDEPSFGDLVATYLERADESFEVLTVTSPSEAIDRLADDGRIDCIVSDYDMPRMDGIELLERVRSAYPDLPFVLFTGKGSEEVASQALAAGATDYLQKQSGTEQYELLANTVGNAVERSRTARRAEHLNHVRYLVGNINKALIRSPSPVEIETRVCKLVSDAEPYGAGGIANVDPESGRVCFRTWSGTGGEQVDERGPTLAGGADEHDGPFMRAVESREIEVSRDIEADLQGARSLSAERELQSIAVVPLEYDGELYGLLAVFGLNDETFHETEQEVLGELGDDIAHALHARTIDTKLDQKSDELATVFEQAESGLMLVDHDEGTLRYSRINERMSELAGRPRTELRGKTPREAFGPEDGGELESVYRSAIEDRTAVEYTKTFELSGRTVTRKGTVAPITEQGTIDQLVVVVRDITRQREQEAELEQATERFRALFQNSPDMIDVLDMDGTIRRANEQFREKLGLSEGEAVGKKVWEIDRRFDEKEVRSLFSSLSCDERRRFEGRYERADGSTFPVAVHLIRLEIGDEERIIAISRDITDRKSWEAERETTIGFLRELYDVTLDSELSFEDKLGRVLELGRETLDLPNGFLTEIDRDSESVDGGEQRIVESTGPHELLEPGETRPLAEAYCRKTIDTDGLLAVEDTADAGGESDPAYERFGFSCYIGGTVETGETLYGTLCFAATAERDGSFTDVERMFVRLMSRWVSYELERHEKKAELERQNERLEQFASVASHDLRNPLNVAGVHLDLAQQDCQSEHLGQVASAHDRMEELIDDMLGLAAAGDRVSGLEPVDIAGTAEECWQNLRTTNARLDTGTDRMIEADRSRLQQLLENLMRNSIEHGGEHVTVTVGGLPDQSGFYLEDDGEGIPQERHERLFEPGYSTETDGTGFGLSIVEEIASAHGWDVDIREGSDGGARFEFTGVQRNR
jgi:PAS domain S-box-containing protein